MARPSYLPKTNDHFRYRPHAHSLHPQPSLPLFVAVAEVMLTVSRSHQNLHRSPLSSAFSASLIVHQPITVKHFLVLAESILRHQGDSALCLWETITPSPRRATTPISASISQASNYHPRCRTNPFAASVRVIVTRNPRSRLWCILPRDVATLHAPVLCPAVYGQLNLTARAQYPY